MRPMRCKTHPFQPLEKTMKPESVTTKNIEATFARECRAGF